MNTVVPFSKCVHRVVVKIGRSVILSLKCPILEKQSKIITLRAMSYLLHDEDIGQGSCL